MNIQNLTNILKASGQTRAILTIDAVGDDAVIVINIPTANSLDLSKNDCNLELRAALSKPLCIMGKVDTINDLVVNEIMEFGEKFSVKCTQLNEPVNATKKTKVATKKATSAKVNTKKAIANTEVVESVEEVVESVEELEDEVVVPDMNLDFFKDLESSSL